MKNESDTKFSQSTPYGGIQFSRSRFPKEWILDLLGNHCKIRRGASPRPAGDPRFFGGNIPWIKISDATRGGSRYIEKTAEYVNEEGARRSLRIPVGSLIIANSGVSLGFAAITLVEGCIHDGWLAISDYKDLDRDYLFYFINNLTGRIRRMADGTTQPNLNTDIARRIVLPLPPMEEQQGIARTLQILDDKIDLNRRMNQTLEAMARAIFKSWFVDFEPVRAGRPLFRSGFTESAERFLPDGWSLGTLSEIAENYRRGVEPSAVDQGTPYIGLEHMPRKSIALGDWGTSTDLASNKSQFLQGEILFGKLRPYFHKIGVAPLDGICSTDILVIGPKKPGFFGIVLGYVSSDDFVNYADRSSVGTKMPRVRWGDMARYPVLIPPLTVAQACSDKLRPLVDMIGANIHQSRTLAAIRDTLLPKLLSGEIRVKQAEKIVGEVV